MNASNAAGSGGKPVTSKALLLPIAARSASGAGSIPAISSRESTNASIGFLTHPERRTCGTDPRSGLRKDQCGCQGAPCSIQRFTIAICAGFSSLCESGGGMTSSASFVISLLYNRDLSGEPFTTTSPSSRFAKIPSSRSRRSPAFREPGSGPWQWKQASAKIGRMSRLKATELSAAVKHEFVAARNSPNAMLERDEKTPRFPCC